MGKQLGLQTARVDEFKSLGSTVQSNGNYGTETKKRVQAGWKGRSLVVGVM